MLTERLTIKEGVLIALIHLRELPQRAIKGAHEIKLTLYIDSIGIDRILKSPAGKQALEAAVLK